MLRKGIVAVGLLLATLTGPALAQNYPLQTSGGLVIDQVAFNERDRTANVSGGGYDDLTGVTLTLFSAPVVLKTVTTDAAGNFATTVTIPASTPPGPHTITAEGLAPDGTPRVLSAAITVTGTGTGTAGAPGAAPGTGGTSAGLARTGSFIAVTAALGLGLTLIGVTLVRRNRRSDLPAA